MALITKNFARNLTVLSPNQIYSLAWAFLGAVITTWALGDHLYHSHQVILVGYIFMGFWGLTLSSYAAASVSAFRNKQRAVRRRV